MGKNSGRSVLITRFSALGDIAMTIPAVYDACRAHPDVAFIFLTRPFPARLFINAPENLTVEAIDTGAYKGAGGLLRLFRELRAKYDFSTMVDLHDVLRTRLLRLYARAAGIRVTHIDKRRRDRRALTRRRHKRLRPLTPVADRYRHALERAGFPAEKRFRSIYEDAAPDPALYAAAAPPPDPAVRRIGIAPFAAHPGKILPFPTVRALTEQLLADPEARIFLFGGGEKESAMLDTLASERVVNVARSGIGIEGELALISTLDVMITMDSANMHFASLTGTRAVTVWGATHPFAGFMGYGQSDADAVQLPLECRPCSIFGNKACAYGDFRCLQRITPSDILARTRRK